MKEKIIPIHREVEVRRSELSDEAVARACATGEASAITMLFDRFHRNVARYIAHLTGSADVDDLVQSTFLEIVKGSSQYDGRASVTTWLFAIATNVVRHHRRSVGRKLRLRAAVARERHHEEHEIEQNMEASRKIAAVEVVIEGLNQSQREAFVLCVLEGLSAREAAHILQTSEAAVWKRVCKARAKIKCQIEEASHGES